MTVGLWWLRRDLRLSDNPALHDALSNCERVIPVFVYDSDEHGDWLPGAASRWWLHHSLVALDRALRERGSRLLLRRGPSAAALLKLASESGASQIFCNRLYEPELLARDAAVAQTLQEQGMVLQCFNAALLNEPWTVRKSDGGPYRVFTPYWNACQQAGLGRPLLRAPQQLPPVDRGLDSLAPSALALLPRHPWDHGLRAVWQPGEDGAQLQWQRFIDQALHAYPEQRDVPATPGTSRLSPHLHFGEIGPRQLWHSLQDQCTEQARSRPAGEAFLRQLGWREFSAQLLYHFPHTSEQPLDARFAHMPWAAETDAARLSWQRGETGIPLVDAGMRELWHHGWMHNRVRMLCASLLTKNLLIPWQQGSRWFWDTLVDADLANNTMGWQWTAGCGADAAPYFRIFNPVLQGQRYDPAGGYVRTWLPELASLPDRFLHRPWEAPAAVLRKAGVRLGDNYPPPLVDLKQTRERALAAYREIRARA